MKALEHLNPLQQAIFIIGLAVILVIGYYVLIDPQIANFRHI